MYAIIKTGGKQYTVSEGKTITVEKLVGEPESTIELTEVLLLSDDSGVRVGMPTLSDVKVVATILEHGRGKKINGFTYRPKKGQHHRYGHRQSQTKLQITSIEA